MKSSQFVITVAFGNKTVALCNKKSAAFCNKLLSHFVITVIMNQIFDLRSN